MPVLPKALNTEMMGILLAPCSGQCLSYKQRAAGKPALLYIDPLWEVSGEGRSCTFSTNRTVSMNS